MPLRTSPAGMWPGHRTIAGTRYAPSQFEFFSLRNGVMPASGQLFMCGPLSVEYMTIVLSARPFSSRKSRTDPTSSSWSTIVSWYADCQRPAFPRLPSLT